MKAFRYIFLTICAFAEASLFAFGITGFIAYRGDPDPDVPIMVVAAVTVCAMVLLGITIKSFINVAKDREAPVIYGFLLKFGLARRDSVCPAGGAVHLPSKTKGEQEEGAAGSDRACAGSVHEG